MKKRYLVLQDGTVFEGYAFGSDKSSIGELIFNTNMVGYIETLTDPVYYGQIVIMTFPMIGNYGIIEADFIGEPKLNGFVVREWCEAPSNFRCEGDIDTFLKEHDVPGIYGVDTRELTNIIRSSGTVNAVICDEIPASLEDVKNYKIVDAVKNTAAKNKTEYVPEGECEKHIAIVDFGSSKNIETQLMEKGYRVTVMPYDSTAEDILSLSADAVILTEGPGNPKDLQASIETVKALFSKLPMFGIGLGHQIMALAKGAETEKLTYGHHGANQPSKIVGTERTLITNQNHNYVVVKNSVKEGAISHLNCNDHTVEGISYKDEKAASVQFEVSADYIIKVMEELINAAE